MVTQINMKFQDNFFSLAKEYSELKGYMSVQELLRDLLRDKIFDELDVREGYKKVLASKEANTFKSIEDSTRFINKMRSKAKNERKNIK